MDKPKALGPFDYVNEINFGKKDIMAGGNPLAESAYVPFITNKSLSYFLDTVLLANEMNMRQHLDKKLQFHFYLNSVRSRKRFAKWHKDEDERIELISEFYKCNPRVARQYAKLLTEEEIEKITLSKGGKK